MNRRELLKLISAASAAGLSASGSWEPPEDIPEFAELDCAGLYAACFDPRGREIDRRRIQHPHTAGAPNSVRFGPYEDPVEIAQVKVFVPRKAIGFPEGQDTEHAVPIPYLERHGTLFLLPKETVTLENLTIRFFEED